MEIYMKAIYRAGRQVSTGKVTQKRTAIMQMIKKKNSKSYKI